MTANFDTPRVQRHDPARVGAPDLYQGVHKGIRNALQANLSSLARLDITDPAEILATAAGLEDVLDWLHEHLAVEETFLHAAIEGRCPDGLPMQVRHDHEQHLRDLHLLREGCQVLRGSLNLGVAARRAMVRRLHLSFSRFVGENFVHMASEETEMNAQLWALFSDHELHEIHKRIMASEPPRQLERATRWMMPALSPEERAAIVLEARASIDPAVFEFLLAQVKSMLSPRDVEKLEAALAAGEVIAVEASTAAA